MLSAAMISDIQPGAGGSNPQNIAAVNGTTFFTANDGTNGTELWKSDGTAAGTVMVKDINPGAGSSSPSYLTNVNGTLFFTVPNDGAHGSELWKSDGTDTGTVLVKDINPGSGDSTPQYLTNVSGTLYFTAGDGVNGRELWKSDGTDAGTVMVKDINPGNANAYPGNLTSFKGALYFSASDGVNGRELWKSDGTDAGTVMVKDINPGVASSFPAYFAVSNDTLFLRADDGAHGSEVWKSDGTTGGTALVKDITSGSGSFPNNLTDFNGMLFFTAYDGTIGTELWKSDGTDAGTVLVKDIYAGAGSSFPNYLTSAGGTLFLTADDGVHGSEIWKSDGTTDGTVLVKDIYSGGSSGNPSQLTNVNGTLLFVANDGLSGYELWRSDGTDAGTVLARDANVGSGSSSPMSLADINGSLYFAANDGATGYELWALKGPTAVAGAYAVDEGETVALSAAASSDPDSSETLSYEWDLDGDGVYGETGAGALRGDEAGATPTFSAVGLDGPASITISLRVHSTSGLSDTASGTVTINNVASPILALGAGAGAAPQVRVLRGSDAELSFFAFDPTFSGGVDVAVGDVTGDGVGDIIVGAGIGGSSHVRIFSGTDGAQIAGPLGSFIAFAGPGGDSADPTSSYYTGAFNGPIHVASGDVNGDDIADVIVSVGADGPPQVKIFSGADGTLLASFLTFVVSSHSDISDPAYFTSAFQGGVSVAAGDINHDGNADLIVSAGLGAGPHVKVFASGSASAMIRSFYAFDGAFRGGVSVTSGDVNNDATDDIIAAAGAGAGPEVKVFSGSDGSVLASFFAYDAGFTGGVRLAGGDYDGDGQFDLFTAPGAGVASDVRRFGFADGHAITTSEDFFAFNENFLGGTSLGV